MLFGKRLFASAAVLLSPFFAPSMCAQIRSGTITGAVLDPSGGVVPDADVAVTNAGTNVATATKTSQSGLYTVPYLEGATYSITIRKAGFEPFEVTGLHLDTSQTARVDA